MLNFTLLSKAIKSTVFFSQIVKVYKVLKKIKKDKGKEEEKKKVKKK
jgi:hypothetical protein